jgi:hypothetical protein
MWYLLSWQMVRTSAHLGSVTFMQSFRCLNDLHAQCPFEAGKFRVRHDLAPEHDSREHARINNGRMVLLVR